MYETVTMEFTITREQILEIEARAKKGCISVIQSNLKNWFPEAFPKLEIGKWYYNEKYDIVIHLTELKYDNVFNGYGFNKDKEWICTKDFGSIYAESCNREATDKEVEEALKAEAKKRFGHDWRIAKIKPMAGDHGGGYNKEQFGVCACDNEIWNRNGCIFKDGIWAEILPEEKTVITKEKALKILAKKLKVSPENIEIQ